MFAIVSVSPVYGHKLISHDDTHTNFDSALLIPDHRISWAIYENLDANEAKFYSFYAKQGDSFYASIVVPKIEGLEEYSPSLFFTNAAAFDGNSLNFDTGSSVEQFLYEGKFPGDEFYEPFGQVTYWERQEIISQIPADGKYFVVVADEKNQNGKYSLAIGTIEDFSGLDLFTLLPKAWLDTKLFVGDYASITISLLVLSVMFVLLPLFIIKKRIIR